MTKLRIFLAIVFVLSFYTSAYGKTKGETGAYIGVGGIFGVESFDDDELGDLAQEHGVLSVDVENEGGVNAEIGYHFRPWFALEFSADYFSDFGDDRGDTEVELATYMVVAKLVDRFYSARPFLCAGLGYMDVDVDFGRPHFVASESESFSDLCGKLGLGLHVFANDHISLGTELAYVSGFFDVDDFSYFSWTVLEAAYHF